MALGILCLSLLQSTPDFLYQASFPWAESLGLRLSFNIDALAQIYLLLILGIGFGIQLFSLFYFQNKTELFRRYKLPMLVFTATMVGVVTADNLLSLFLFWELTSLSSFFLIGLERERITARASAQMALIVTGAGGLCLLGGILLLAKVAGSFEISQILANSSQLVDHPWMPVIFILFAIGALTKSAQFPFHFWLPNAMAAPAPVSAYLHSATMVKLGIFLLLRFHPAFGSLALWYWILTVCGGITFVWGSWVALHKTDLKTLLANTTISGLGFIVMCIGIGTPMALSAALVFLVAHALYKAPLFLLVGLIEKKIGTRDLRELHKLGFRLPILTIAMALAAGSMAGLPPWLGFVAKELLFGVALPSGPWILACTFSGSVLTIATAFRLAHAPFWGHRDVAEVERPLHKSGSLSLGMVPLVFALTGLALGLFAPLVGETLIDPALAAIGAADSLSSLSLWHGVNAALVLGMGSWIVGLLIYRFRSHIESFGSRAFFDGDGAYDFTMRSILSFGARLTTLLQNGSLPFYLMVNLLCLIATGYMAYWLATRDSLDLILRTATGPVQIDFQQVWGILLCFLMMGMAALTLTTRYALTAVLAMGGVGFSIAIFFGFFGAPDLALTQLAVECLGLLLFALILPSMPPFHRVTSSVYRRSQTFVSVMAGFMIFVVVWISLLKGNQSELTPFFAQNSWLAAHGRNVVNVILVDFRGLDTMGEVTVLVIAALGIARLAGRPARGDR